jgi:hypothetical protein
MPNWDADPRWASELCTPRSISLFKLGANSTDPPIKHCKRAVGTPQAPNP